MRAAEQFDDDWRRRMDERLCAVFTMLPPSRFWTIKSTALDARADEALGVLKTYLESFENAPKIKF